jgi:hypothetical protein
MTPVCCKRDRSVPWISTQADLDEAMLEDLEIESAPSNQQRRDMAAYFRKRIASLEASAKNSDETMRLFATAWVNETDQTRALKKRVVELEQQNNE